MTNITPIQCSSCGGNCGGGHIRNGAYIHCKQHTASRISAMAEAAKLINQRDRLMEALSIMTKCAEFSVIAGNHEWENPVAYCNRLLAEIRGEEDDIQIR